MVIDESHQTIPQTGGDVSRATSREKEDAGRIRVPSAECERQTAR